MQNFLVCGRSLLTRLAAVVALLACSALSSAQTQQPQQQLSTLLFFNGSQASGGLVQGDSSPISGGVIRLYGTATSNIGPSSGGIIFDVSTDSTQLLTDYQFGRFGIFNGAIPHGGLLRATDHNFYGTTQIVAIDPLLGTQSGSGTIYGLSQLPDGSYGYFNLLHTFQDPSGSLTGTTSDNGSAFALLINSDGISPRAGLIQGIDGYLYGTAVNGGTNGTGTIFKIAMDGTSFRVLYNFGAPQITGNGIVTRNVDGKLVNVGGAFPQNRLAQASDGKLYGVTPEGGTNGTGVIFTINIDGSGFDVLKEFDVSPPTITDTANPNFGLIRTNLTGAYPQSALTQAKSTQLLYGTTSTFGTSGYGNVYAIATDGSGYQAILNFNAVSPAGIDPTLAPGTVPAGDLIESTSGYLVGTTASGGLLEPSTFNTANATGSGTLFKIKPDGSGYNTLFVFGADAINQGTTPSNGVIEASDGNFYGTTSRGGPYNLGTIFQFGTNTTAAFVLGTPQRITRGAMSMWLLTALLVLALVPRRRKTQS